MALLPTTAITSMSPPQRMARMAKCKNGNYARADSWVSGPVDFLTSGRYLVVGGEHWALQLQSGYLIYQTNVLPDGIVSAEVPLRQFKLGPFSSWAVSLRC